MSEHTSRDVCEAVFLWCLTCSAHTVMLSVPYITMWAHLSARGTSSAISISGTFISERMMIKHTIVILSGCSFSRIVTSFCILLSNFMQKYTEYL